jgi:rfaE bifunctional protein nucleotidyltransferase chain/domain
MREPSAKLLALDEAARRADALRRKGARIVVANGAFDLLHVGHVRYLAAARQAGDVLFVAVNSDASVRILKGAGRPIVPESERIELLSHLACVDWLVRFDEPTVVEVLRALRPDVHAKGTDYTEESVPEHAVLAEWGGRTLICGDPKDHATTDLIDEILRKEPRNRQT